MEERVNKSREFVKNNIAILTNKLYNKERIKELKKQFFVETYKNKFGKPSDGEIAKETIFFLKINGKVKSMSDVEDIVRQIPFLSKNIHNLAVFTDFFSEDSKENWILTSEDLSKLNQIEYLRKKEIEIEKKVIEEKGSDINKALEEKRKEYESFPSVLDSTDFEEPGQEREPQDEESKEWWQLLGLTSDPFPRQEGLDKIPENIYEKVIYKSDLIQDYKKKIESNREKVLNKGILIVGNFGTGKTTFFDYLSYYLIRNKICPLRMTFTPKADIFTYSSEFETKLYSLLKKTYSEHHGDYFNGPPNYENSKKIMLEMKEDGWSFMVIIDDLHKHIGFEEVVLRFLSTLQIVKDDIIRSKIDIGFMVAGIPSWKIKMNQDTSLPGFFDTTPEEIPEVSPESAYSVINNRLAAYSINPRKKNIVDLNWIKQIHRKIKNDGLFVHYRILIDHVLKELKNKNFDILESNYIDIPDKIFLEIKNIFREQGILDLFENLLNKQNIKTDENKIQCFNLIIQLYLYKRIKENEPQFINSKFHFKKLLNLKIICKIKEDLGFSWVLDPKITKTLDDVSKKYNLCPEDYLKKLFFIQEKRVEKEITEIDVIQSLEAFIGKYGSLLRGDSLELIKNSLSLIKEYERVHTEEIDTKKYEENTKLLITSLSDISRAIFLLEGRSDIPSEDKELLNFWKDYWFYPNSLANFVNEVWYNRTYPSREKAGYVYLYFKESYEDLVSYIWENIPLNANIVIPYTKLKETEIKEINQVRKNFSTIPDGQNYFNILKKMNNLLENKFRIAFFNHFNIIYGNIYERLNKLGDLKPYIEKIGIEYSNYFFNEFQNLNRGEYKKLILENPRLKKQYFKFLFKDWDNNQLETFLDIFCETNIIISHLKTQKIDSADQGYVFRVVLNSIEMLKMINDMYLRLLDDYFYFITGEKEVICYFSLPGKKIHDKKTYLLNDKNELQNVHEIKGVRISLEEVNRVYSKLEQYASQNNNKYILDLEDFGLIYNLFTIEYNKFISIIALLNYSTMTKLDDKFKLNIRPFFGSKIILGIN